MKGQSIFSGNKNKKSIINLLSVEFTQRVVKVKTEKKSVNFCFCNKNSQPANTCALHLNRTFIVCHSNCYICLFSGQTAETLVRLHRYTSIPCTQCHASIPCTQCGVSIPCTQCGISISCTHYQVKFPCLFKIIT